MTELRPLFVLSVSRSGSTLLQRVLAAYDEVATTAEPWILMPLLAPLRASLPGGASWQAHTHGALVDFARHLPRGMDDYRAAVREFAMRLYGEAAGTGARYFLDKTPSYYTFPDELIEAFPNGRFIFLWRNPLSIIASLVDTWHHGRFDLHVHRRDLFDGLPKLVAARTRHEGRTTCVRFEDLVAGEEGPWRGLAEHLEIEFRPETLTRFGAIELEGRMGDPTGTRRYATLSTEPLDKWRATLSNPLRRSWCGRYLRWLGRERLAVMGFDLDELLEQLEHARPTLDGLAGDSLSVVKSVGREIAMSRARSTQIRSWRALLTPR